LIFFQERSLEPEFLGNIVENLLATVLKTQFFWRERQNEVDFVLEEDRKRIPIEVKWKEKVKNRDLKGILNVYEKFHADKGIILTKMN